MRRIPRSALAFINYIETPQVHAAITNTMFYPNANKEARKYVVNVADNPMIYPSPEVSKTLCDQGPALERPTPANAHVGRAEVRKISDHER